MQGSLGRKALYLCSAGAIAVVILALLLFNGIMSRELSVSSCQTIEELMGQKKFTFISQIEGEMAVSETIASLLASGLDDFHNREEVLDHLRDAAAKSRFNRVFLADLSGRALSSEGVVIDIGDREYFRCALKGKACLSDPINSMIVKDQTIVNFAAPVFEKGKVAAVFVGTYVTSDLSKLFFSSYNGEGYAYICDADGVVITRASRQTNGVKTNILAYLEDGRTLRHDDYSTIVANMKAGLSGHGIYLKNGEKKLLHYSPIGLNGWYIFVIVPDEVIAAQGNYLMFLTVVLTVFIILVFSVLILYLVVSQRKFSRLLYRKAYYNDLTDSPNQAKFREDAGRVLKENPHTRFAAMRISIEGLDFLNEIFGYATGDKLLRAVAQTFREICTRPLECFAHIYADRFVALFVCGSFEEMEARQAEFERLFAEKIAGLVSYNVKFAVGMYLVEPGEADVYAMLEKVSFAHNAAKKSERREDKVQKYDIALKAALKLERDVESKMERALTDHEFSMFLQPKYALSDERLVGAEALARWWVSGKYIMYPTDFIPIFEKNGFIVHLDMYMFEEACKFLKAMMDDRRKLITISANFSRLHLLKGDFVPRLCAIADKYAVPHRYLEVEITESSMVGNESLLMSVLEQLHAEDFTLSMDDFGSGYSSLGLLKEIPIDVVKIDRSFFEASREIERERIVIESVIDMAKKLKIHTVAEGVETQEHIDFLKLIGCEIVQGYYYSKPIPFEEFYKQYVVGS